MKPFYVIAVQYKYPWNDDWEENYAGFDSYSGSYSTGYPCWLSNIHHAKHFKSIDEAEKFLKDNFHSEWLLSKTHEEGERIKANTLCIKKIEAVEVKSLNYKDFIEE